MNATDTKQPDLIELEIAAFMGPHIQRARIALVIIGGLYAWLAYRSWGDVSAARALMSDVGEDSPGLAALKSAVNLAYVIVAYTGFAGVANLVLAAIAGKKATFAMYAAMGIFAVHTALQLYAGGLVFTNWLWWVSAIVLGMGFQAAYKAQQLRKNRQPAEARLAAAI
jgi:hypothetical protein